MGNALNFLADKNNRDKYRKGSHHAECNRKIDKYLETNNAEQCPEQVLVKVGTSRSQKVNKVFNWESNLLGYRSRRAGKRKQQPCTVCKKLFTPHVKIGRLTRADKEKGYGHFTIWCPICTRKGTTYRNMITKVGSLERYEELKSEILPSLEISKLKSLRDLFEERDRRVYLDKTTRTTDNTINKVIERAYKDNKIFDEKLHHYEFDF